MVRRAGANIVVVRQNMYNLENQQQWQAKKLEQMRQLSKQKDAIKIWETVKNILNPCLNTETLNPYTCLRHFSTLFMKQDKAVLVMEVQIIDLDPTDDFDNDLTMQEMKEVTLGMENNKVTGFDSIACQQEHGRCWLPEMKDLKF
jgi:hypothetical protein